jgi:hypothetical protein
MEVKKKTCKGNGQAKGSGCGEIKYIHKFGLCQNCFKDWLFTTNNGKEYLNKSMIIGKKKAHTEIRKQRKIEKDSIRKWDVELQKNINKIVRTIDKGCLCLARNIRGQMHGGHIFSVGSNRQIRYNLHNIHRQSAHSNHFQNEDGLFREGLIQEYGNEYMDFIKNLRSTPNLHHSNIEYQELNDRALAVLKRLKKDDLTYSLQMRIELRNKINLELGIYDKEFCIFNNLK